MRAAWNLMLCSLWIISLAQFSLSNPVSSNGQEEPSIPENGKKREKIDYDARSPSRSKSGTSYVDNPKKVKDRLHPCRIYTQENLHDFIDIAEEEEKVNLFEFTIKLKNYSYDPFENSTGLFFKPWLWYTTRSRHGRTLLMLSFHYDVLSMNILTIGVKKIDVEIMDYPKGCFGGMSTAQQMSHIRMMLLNRSHGGQSSSYGKSARWVLASNRDEFACNQEIESKNGNGDFVYNCCFKDTSGNVICSSKGDDFWINILYFAITSVKILMFLFCPKFLPNNIYSAAYVASEYVVTLKKALKMKLFISEQADANVRFKKRLTLEEVSDWWKFRETLDNLPCDEIVPIKISELRIKVKGKRIIPENDPPTGLMRTMYDNLVRCKIKNLDPFTDCCETSIYAEMEPKFRHKVTWHKFVQAFVKGLLLLLVPIPYYIRLIIYFMFEAPEINARRQALEDNNLEESFSFYKTNVIQFFSPTHGIFIATYIFYFFSGLIIGFSDQSVRDRLKGVARSALGDMAAVSQTGVLGIIIRALLYPFKRCGLIAFLLGPIYLVFVIPLCSIVFTIYCIPTVYLSFRLPYHAKKLFGVSVAAQAVEKKRRMVRMHKLGKRLSKMDKSAHHGGAVSEEEGCFPEEWNFSGLVTVRNIIVQIVSSIFCLCILYSIALVFAESIGLFVEVMAFTMMGIIVNAGTVLKYVSMVLLVFVYMNDCYSNVYENYLTFNKTIIDDMIDRTTADLRKIASMPSSQQENTAFQVKCVDEEKETEPSLNFDKKEIRWKLGQLLLFLDCFDTPRIPLRFFKKTCQIRVYGAPGPVYINLLAATGKFMIIVIFLMFVMLVVMAFGNVYQMSSTNTTLATLAGGFVPMLLKNVLSSKGTKLSLKTVSFKGQIDEIIGEYKQYWPVMDLHVQRYTPGEDEEEEEGGEGEGKDEKKDEKKDGGDEKDGASKDGKEPDEKKSDENDKTPEAAESDKKQDSGEIKDDKLLGDKAKEAKDLGEKPKDETKKNGDAVGAGASPTAQSKPEEDENLVDLFIDLSVADTAGWSIYGSSESLPSQMSNAIMPGYFDPNKNMYEEEMSSRHHYSDTPPPV